MPTFPSCAGHCQRGPLLSHPFQNTEVGYTAENGERLGAQQAGFGMHQRDTNPTNCFADSIRGTTHKLLVGPCQQIPPAGPQAFPTLPTPHPHNLLPCNQLPVCAPQVASTSIGRELVSTRRKLAQLCKTVRKQTNLNIYYHLRKSKADAVSTRSSLLD